MRQYGYACACCGNQKDDLELDHLVPFYQLFGTQPQVMQPLHATCHLDKSVHEGGVEDNNCLVSHFERHVWGANITSKRPTPIAWKIMEVNEKPVNLSGNQ